MSFRQPKSDATARAKAWREWLARHGPSLGAAGLPPEVTRSADHWVDFLQNGSLDLHPEASSGFSFDVLAASQMHALLDVLEASPAYADQPMAGWLRHRLAGRPVLSPVS